MRLSGVARFVGGGVVAMVLSACGSGQSSTAPVTPAIVGSSARENAAQARPSMRGHSSGQDLLYVSVVMPAASKVYVYTYPQGKLFQTLSGFLSPVDECADSTGNVFITSYANYSSSSGTIYEYAHGGQTPIAELNDPGLPWACSVDPTTGNLAVSNPYDRNSPYNPQLGSIAIYAGAKGNPTMYYSSKFDTGACGYDNSGNLYLVGATPPFGRQELLVRLAKGARRLEQVKLDRKIYIDPPLFNPSVQWDGQHMTISSVYSHNPSRGRGRVFVYQLSISGRRAKAIGVTKLVALRPDMHGGQSWIQGNAIVGSDYRHHEGWVSYWDYPKGGYPTHNIPHIVPMSRGEITGVTISVAPSHHGSGSRRSP